MDTRANERSGARALRLGALSGGSRPSPGPTPPWRVPLLILGFVGLVSATGGGLARLGVVVPEVAASWAGLHAALMICGFFGVVISLERAVAIGRWWPYAAPLLAGAGSGALLHGFAGAAPWLYGAASLVLLAASADIVRRQRALFTVTMTLGAACWSVGIALWLAGRAPYEAVPWWLAFLILTIAGERLELSRLRPPSALARALFALLLVAVLGGLVAATLGAGTVLFGVALAGLALWLLKQDIARRTVHDRGLTRYIAVCLLAGYGWLAVGGALFASGLPMQPGQPAYDAALHALGLGFVFSMVLGHAPIIFPAVLRVNVPYHASFYGPLVLLHVSVLLRLAGDAFAAAPALRAGAALNAIALAAFILATAAAVWRGRRDRAGALRRS